MSIWNGELSIETANENSKNCLVGHLGIEFTEKGDDYLVARMDVTQIVCQPANVLHGGASVVLAETVATWAATMVVDRERFHCVGLEINANHIRPVPDGGGYVYATARPLHLGRTTQIWSIEIRNEQEKLVCTSRMTAAILEKPSQY